MGNKGMDMLIPIVNKLQETFSKIGKPCPLDLPQIAVVGGQSAGKSSVLENFVGRDFLPRGSGIVTRRPLVLQLQFHPNSEFGEFAHTGSKKFTDFDAIRKEIEDETDRLTGSKKNISNIPISLKIYSPHVLNLTLVDLPGMTKVAVGDQPKDIEMQIRNMLLEFISKPNCLILAVSPANSDLANSDALKLAKEVDPQGLRTIGVLTKLDLMDAGTDARDILDNKFLPLRRGYIGVVNRSQKAIDTRKRIEEALADEHRFFVEHPAYSSVANKHGTAKLQQVLNQQLTNHIRDSLPDLKKQLGEQLEEIEEEVKDFKDLGADSKGLSIRMMTKLIFNYGSDLTKLLDGGRNVTNWDELSPGAKINIIFNEKFPFEIIKYETDEKELRREIMFAIKNIHGIRSGLFTPDQAFEAICQKLIKRLKDPSLYCCDLAYAEVEKAIHECIEKMSAFPKLYTEVERMSMTLLQEAKQVLVRQVEGFIDIELAYKNTVHPDFIGFVRAANGEVTQNSTNIIGKKPSASANFPDIKNFSPDSLSIIRKGFVNSPMGLAGASKEYWFVLSTEGMYLYKDQYQKDIKYYINLYKCRVIDSSKNLFRRFQIEIYSLESKFLFKDNKSLVMIFRSAEEADAWKASLLRVGVFPEKAKRESEPNEMPQSISTIDVAEVDKSDPLLENQIQTIRNLIDSYMSIVGVTIRDRIPKTIVLIMINRLLDSLNHDIFGCLLVDNSAEALMEESEAEREHRIQMMEMYQMLKGAIKVIGEINVGTTYEEAPPPISEENDIIAQKLEAEKKSGSRNFNMNDNQNSISNSSFTSLKNSSNTNVEKSYKKTGTNVPIPARPAPPSSLAKPLPQPSHQKSLESSPVVDNISNSSTLPPNAPAHHQQIPLKTYAAPVKPSSIPPKDSLIGTPPTQTAEKSTNLPEQVESTKEQSTNTPTPISISARKALIESSLRQKQNNPPPPTATSTFAPPTPTVPSSSPSTPPAAGLLPIPARNSSSRTTNSNTVNTPKPPPPVPQRRN